MLPEAKVYRGFATSSDRCVLRATRQGRHFPAHFACIVFVGMLVLRSDRQGSAGFRPVFGTGLVGCARVP
eukprot:scaffold120631_cov57-Phaeocystis_antarctica.AAC.2